MQDAIEQLWIWIRANPDHPKRSDVLSAIKILERPDLIKISGISFEI